METLLYAECQSCPHRKLSLDVRRSVQRVDLSNSGVPNPYKILSERERQVLTLYAKWKKPQLIEQKLNISISTIDTHLKNIREKLNIQTRHGLVQYAKKSGLLTDVDDMMDSQEFNIEEITK